MQYIFKCIFLNSKTVTILKITLIKFILVCDDIYIVLTFEEKLILNNFLILWY